MRKKTIAIGTQFENTKIFYKEILESILGGRFHIVSYNFDEYTGEKVHPDVLLISTPFMITAAKKHVHDETKIIRIRRTFTKKAYEQLSKIDSDQDILLVNNGIDVTYETIALIYSLGFDFRLHPSCPELETPGNITHAITTDEEHLVPPQVHTVHNIGHMVYAVSTIHELLEFLDTPPEERDRILHQYKKNVIPHETGLHTLLDSNVVTKIEMQAILDLIGDGVIKTDNKGLISMVNSKAEVILNMSKESMINQHLDKVFNSYKGTFLSQTKDVLIHLNGEQIIVNSRPTYIFDKKNGAIVTLKKVTELRKLEKSVSRQISIKGHKASYTFNGIIGNSAAILKTKRSAKRMAASDSSIVISGESGTGKELFAQAIHNASARRKFPFVAVNCAALPENLIESELFGYEAGSFTGASATGKPGLFEEAHLGTLFLDEIGDISQNLQVRLLRVLQEKEIIRVGSSKVRKVDVRIISATNKNLLELTQNGLFRWDLYYRLNVFPLRIPPLRDRKDDVPELFSHFLEEFNCHKAVSEELLSVLYGYDWPGNIRELRNAAEYMSQMGSNPLQIGDLPITISKMPLPNVSSPAGGGIQCESTLSQQDVLLLRILRQRKLERKKTGRVKLVELLERKKHFLTEREVRNKLTFLHEQGFVKIGAGRQGTSITPRGEAFLNSCEDIQN